jgi:pyruvate,water dikinase
MDKAKKFILWWDELSIEDVPLVGGKNASLGEMYRTLTSKGVRVPNGFAITAYAYRYLLEHAGIQQAIRDAMKGLNTRDMENLAERGRRIREIIHHAEFPPELEHAIVESYKKLSKQYGTDNVDVAVRSSATAEDLPDASFAGQQETFLNVKGAEHLIESCKNCFASLFTNRAISYRTDKNFDHFAVYLSIGVQKMVRSDRACSGVMFTLDTETGFKDAIFLTGAWGLGENVVQGAVNPDEFYIHKPTLKQGFKPIINKILGEKAIKMIYSEDGSKPTKNIPTPLQDRQRFVLDDDEILLMAKWGAIIEDHYTQKRKKWTPMDIEWAKDGITGQLFIVQARPETIQSRRNQNVIESYTLKQKGKVLAKGKSVGSKIGQGVANVIKSVHDMKQFKPGQVLITDMTDPDWEPIMKIASAIVTNRGGRTCHAAIISRELGVPCVVGTNTATEDVKNGTKVTVSCAEGEEGLVYEGLLRFDVKKTDISNVKMPKHTKVKINVGNPEEAFTLSFLPTDGVGLARMEFIINTYIKVHPMALIHFERITEPALRSQINEITRGYDTKEEFFVDKLAQGIAMMCAAFYPREVILRTSDFKTNEYCNLIGGMLFEPKEENPMMGWRGASRYYKPGYEEGFALECEAMKRVRDEMGLTNLKIMIPMCRTITEGKKVQAVMAKNGLKRGKNGLELYVMCEVPANVILADQFAKIFDGFSIGSNDLTQFTLAVDRDSQLVADVYDERNDAVTRFISQGIKRVHDNGRVIGICGQAPSDYPEFAAFLVKNRIDSISLNPDSLLRTIPVIVKAEGQR